MFTVKLMRGNTIKLVESETVHIYPAGKAAAENEPCTDRVRGISVTLHGNMQVFHVGDDPTQIAGDVDLYDCAYIENSNGATTERVYARH